MDENNKNLYEHEHESEHDHKHEHEHCHEHEHNHGHSHECGCSHDHGCGCSHEHSEEKPNFVLYGVSAALFIASLFLNSFSWSLCVAATVICGYKIFLSGITSLFKLKFNENTLIVIAAAAAICLGDFSEAFLITFLFSIGELIEDYAVDKSRSKIEELINITDDIAYNELGEKIDASHIKKGDVILIKPGDKVCTDAKIIKGNSSFDTSNLTGESIPADIGQGSQVLAGYINLNSTVICEALCDYGNSTAAKIKDYVQNASQKKADTEKFITKFARIYTPAVIIIAACMAVMFPLLKITNAADAVKRALTFMIASCPCAVVISIPLAYFSAIGAASKLGVLIKGSKFINTLARADAIAFDKTGTITKGTLTVKEIKTFNERSEDEVLSYACALENGSSHPIAKAVCNHFKGSIPACDNIKEVFGKGITGFVNGKKITVGNSKMLDENTMLPIEIQNASIYVCEDSVLIGAITLEDEIRTDAAQTINKLSEMHYSGIYMLSGDNKAAVKSVCDKLGNIVGFDSLLPTEKTEKIDEIKRKHKSVVYVGDGVNDAPSLTASDFGISVGNANALALEAGDATLLSSNLNSIPKTVMLARYTMRVIYANLIFSLAVKLAVLIFAALGMAPIWLALFADVGVLIITVLCSVTILYKK